MTSIRIVEKDSNDITEQDIISMTSYYLTEGRKIYEKKLSSIEEELNYLSSSIEEGLEKVNGW